MTPHAASMAAEYARSALRWQRQRVRWMGRARKAKADGKHALLCDCVELARMANCHLRESLTYIRRMASV